MTTLNHFMADPEFSKFRSHVKEAKAVLIVPRLYKSAFFVGGAGDALLVRDEKTGAGGYSRQGRREQPEGGEAPPGSGRGGKAVRQRAERSAIRPSPGAQASLNVRI